MKISIITVSLNNADTIEETIKSVAAQDYGDIEYIVVDGKSTDGTVDIVKKSQGVISRWVSETDKGLFDALNKGIRMATGEVVGLIHADDVFADRDVVSLVAEKMEMEKADVVWGDLVYVDRNDTSKVVRYWKSSPYDEGKFELGWMPPHTTFFARKRLFEECGYYKLDFGYAADYELMLRFIKVCGAKTAYIPKILVKMRVGGVSDRSLKNLKFIIKNNLLAYRAWKENGLEGGLLVPILKPLSKILQNFKTPPSL